MSTDEMLYLDATVSRALGRRVPRESIFDAAERIMDAPRGNRAWRVAREIVLGRGEPWSKMRRAARIARRSGLVSGES
jgi:hypothetical protein